MTTARVVVFGSLNADVTFEVHRIPVAGETVVADAVRRASGGKGANQAHAAAGTSRVPVLMAGAVGRDEAGARLRDDLVAVGVDVSLVREVDTVSGMAMIAVDDDGRNVIVVAPGANHEWPELPEVPVTSHDVVVLQLELPLAVVDHVARTAAAAGARVVLNAAPVTAGAAALVPHIDVLVVNELEATDLLGLGTIDEISVRDAASTHDVDIVVTLGADGAIVAPRGGESVRLRALVADAVDTVGAGDAFVGAFGAALAAGADLVSAARRGTAAGAATVTIRGARHPELSPRLVDDLLDRHPRPIERNTQ